GLVDAAAVCANFNMMVRIADGTGTPLDAGSVPMSQQLRGELGLDELSSRRLPPQPDGGDDHH
ncbi:MAG: alkylhydroperoxidase-related (seleno)protein, partial [Acidimicrobiales bacterium]